MSAISKPKLTAAEYLAIERKAEFKSEFFQGEMFAMAGASRFHNRVKENLSIEIGSRLKGSACQSYSSDQRVLVDRTGLYTYPDIVIICGALEFDPADEDTISNPTVICEVLSPSTEKYDRGAKFRNYQQISSLREYILIAQDQAFVERFVRNDEGLWTFASFIGVEDTLELASVPANIPLADIYKGVDFPTET